MTSTWTRYVPFLLYLIITTNATPITEYTSSSPSWIDGEVVVSVSDMPAAGIRDDSPFGSRTLTTTISRASSLEKRPFNRPIPLQAVDELGKDDDTVLTAQSNPIIANSTDLWKVGMPWVLAYPGAAPQPSIRSTEMAGPARKEGNAGFNRSGDIVKLEGLTGLKSKLEIARLEALERKRLRDISSGKSTSVDYETLRGRVASSLESSDVELGRVENDAQFQASKRWNVDHELPLDSALLGSQLAVPARLILGDASLDSGRHSSPAGGSVSVKRSGWKSHSCLMSESETLGHLIYSLGQVNLVRTEVVESRSGFEGSPLLDMVFLYENPSGGPTLSSSSFEKSLWPYVKGSTRIGQEIELELELERGLRHCLGLPWNSIFIVITSTSTVGATADMPARMLPNGGLMIKISLTVTSDRSFEKLRRDIATVLETI